MCRKKGYGQAVRLIGGEFSSSRIWPVHESLWPPIEGTEALVCRKPVTPKHVEVIVGKFASRLLLERCTFVIFQGGLPVGQRVLQAELQVRYCSPPRSPC